MMLLPVLDLKSKKGNSLLKYYDSPELRTATMSQTKNTIRRSHGEKSCSTLKKRRPEKYVVTFLRVWERKSVTIDICRTEF